MRNKFNKILRVFGYRLIDLKTIEEDISDLEIYRDIYRQKMIGEAAIVNKLFKEYCGWSTEKIND